MRRAVTDNIIKLDSVVELNKEVEATLLPYKKFHISLHHTAKQMPIKKKSFFILLSLFHPNLFLDFVIYARRGVKHEAISISPVHYHTRLRVTETSVGLKNKLVLASNVTKLILSVKAVVLNRTSLKDFIKLVVALSSALNITNNQFPEAIRAALGVQDFPGPGQEAWPSGGPQLTRSPPTLAYGPHWPPQWPPRHACLPPHCCLG